MPCRYCGERDWFNLFLSSRLVNGIVETIEICFSCYWLDRFRVEGENGRIPEFEEGMFDQTEFYELPKGPFKRRNGKFNKRDLL